MSQSLVNDGSQPAAPAGRRVLLVVSGGIAAYKTPDLVRRLRARGIAVRCVMTRAAAEFVAPLSLAAVSEDKVYSDLFSLTDEHEMGHIQLSRDADLIVVAPATAHLLARMAHGLADDLASTVLLATDAPVMVAPAMNVRMWTHPATEANLALLRQRGVAVIGPEVGDMACGEHGPGRMTEPETLADAVAARLAQGGGTVEGASLTGRRALVTSGPTHEPIDPVRYIANRSSGRQGHAIAAALADLGAEVTLVSGPVTLPDPPGVTVVPVESAQDMLAACRAALPVDIAVCAAAVADWRVASAADQKLKKPADAADAGLTLTLTQNPDILATLSAAGPDRPALVVGFAAETERVVEHARDKRRRKGCDWIVANDVSPASGTFGGADNSVHLITADAGEAAVEAWPAMAKTDVAARLARRLAAAFSAPRRPQ
jgi:phosphopantothenoylcysteine decarboxylase/phosphopantothenate--cysteine ligase